MAHSIGDWRGIPHCSECHQVLYWNYGPFKCSRHGDMKPTPQIRCPQMFTDTTTGIEYQCAKKLRRNGKGCFPHDHPDAITVPFGYTLYPGAHK